MLKVIFKKDIFNYLGLENNYLFIDVCLTLYIVIKNKNYIFENVSSRF
jgi:hypothetical protein